MLSTNIINTGYIIGSQGLGVEEAGSDYDAVFLLEDISEPIREFLEKRFESGCDFNIVRYFNVLPEGNGWVFQHVKAKDSDKIFDLIILEDTKDFINLKDAFEDIKEIPRYMVKKKATRIGLFELALVNNGWNNGKDLSYNIEF